MKAIVSRSYGSPDVLTLEDAAMPTPDDNDVLIKIHAASVNPADWRMLRANPFFIRLMGFGFLKPKNKILGADVAGRVEAVGQKVQRFQVGDQVFGDLSVSGWGGFAEYACASADALVPMPSRITFEQAAAVPMAAVTALQGLRDKGRIQPGQRVLVNGASGGVGTFAVQIAKALGAEVTGVCSTRNLDLVRSLGADEVIDYTQEDFTANGRRYDLILDAAAYRSVLKHKRALNREGRYVLVGGSLARTFQTMIVGPWISMTEHKSVGSMLAKPNNQDLATVTELVEAGQVAPVIDRCYPLGEVPEALRYLEKGRARGKVVVTVQGS